MEHGKNDNTEELRRERRSLQGKINRRRAAILDAEHDISHMSRRLREVQQQLDERKRKG